MSRNKIWAGRKNDVEKKGEKKKEAAKACACCPVIINIEETGDQQGKIFRVHVGLRKSNPDAYQPMLISTGPYHWYNGYLMAMKGYKKRCCDSLIARRGDSVDKYKQSLTRLSQEAAKSYAFQEMSKYDKDQFVEMLLLDGSFIAEFVRECWESQQHEAAALSDRKREKRPKASNGPIFSFHWMYAQASRDLLLFENQLPYFVLLELYEMSKDPTTKCSFNDMVKCALKSILPAELYSFPISKHPNDLPEIKHLLHAAHTLCCPSSTDDHQKENPNKKAQSSKRKIDEGKALVYQMRTATELQEAGVRFKKVNVDEHNQETNGISSIFDIKFHNGVMEIPSRTIEDSTESLFRNLIAHEQYSPGLNPKHFSDYAIFMDCLINSSKDVAILRLEGILVNLLGDDTMVADMFNKLGDAVIVLRNFYYSEVFDKVDEHCQKPWNTAKATLRHEYFRRPLAAISIIAAGVLLGLTLAQTIGTFIGLRGN